MVRPCSEEDHRGQREATSELLQGMGLQDYKQSCWVPSPPHQRDILIGSLSLLYWLETEVREKWKQRNHYKNKLRVENVLGQDGSIGDGKK